MIEKEQIAHDLAVSKLCGSDLQTVDLIKQYRQHKGEILSALKSEPIERRQAIIGSPPPQMR